jgi:hypothetical protein
MSYRFTNTEKWSDAWFSNLKQIEMLLFIYLCDNCDIAGFIEVNYKRWSSDLGSSIDTMQGACKGLARGLMFSKTDDCIYLRNFLKHQKNLPLNENNKAHMGIIKRFVVYADKFEIENINEFIEGASKGLLSPSGIGNGIGIGNNSNEDQKTKTWRNDFETYLTECKNEYRKFYDNEELIKKQEMLNPNVNIKLTVIKGFENFWSKQSGWNHKKKCRTTISIDWESTIINSITNQMNRVFYTKEEQLKLQA